MFFQVWMETLSVMIASQGTEGVMQGKHLLVPGIGARAAAQPSVGGMTTEVLPLVTSTLLSPEGLLLF